MRVQKYFIALIIFSIFSYVSGQETTQPPETADPKDFFTELSTNSKPQIKILNIDPERGPVSGETRVTVRGGPFRKWVNQYQKPICAFGNYTIPGVWVTCPKQKASIQEQEARKAGRDYYCIMCEQNVPTSNEGSVDFRVSLIGDFSDSLNSVDFTFYAQIGINRIQPRYGPKDGGTIVQIWGQNFKTFSDAPTLCSFGTKTVVAQVKNATYAECRAPQSEVVAKAIPLSISQNDQQFSLDTMKYYYYNFPTLKDLTPPRGPESGDTNIMLKGSNFNPFHEILNEVDNSIDVYCGFIDLKVRVKAIIENSNIAYCRSPPSYYWHQSRVELTLNAVDYTEDENIFYYYKPPIIYDIEPREGPTKGGTQVFVSGIGFENNNTTMCSFGSIQVLGKYINPQQIRCDSPPVAKPGYVPLKIAVQPNLWSSPIKYLYYEPPVVATIYPNCGPDFGFTQIEVTGQNFIDFGTNKAMCVFNKTIFTNATIISDTLLYCDSPAFQNNQGYSLIGSKGPNTDWYEFQLTMDGGKEIEQSGLNFYYFKQPQVIKVTPFGGPLTANTPVKINVTGLSQPNLCQIIVRFSTNELTPKQLNSDQLQVFAPSSAFSGTVVVQVSYNGQQFTDERVLHFKDPLASYEYYSDPLATFHHPNQGPTVGGTKVSIEGQGFASFKEKSGSPLQNVQYKNELFVRFVNPSTKSPIHQIELAKNEFRNDLLTFITPPQPANTQALIQISRNGVDWHDVKDPNPQVAHSYTYYPVPHISKVYPSFGPVKPLSNTTMTIYGTDFVCPDNNCKNLQCRLTDRDNNEIFTPCQVNNQTTISAQVPKYTKPDILVVEISINGHDYTNDKKTYGYFDPYVIDAQPRLIMVSGSTNVTVYGIGFVDSGELKVKYQNSSIALTCSGAGCIQDAQFISQNRLIAPTFPQSQVLYQNTNISVMWNPIKIGVSVYSDQFTDPDSHLSLFYIREVNFTLLDDDETPSNIPDEVLIQAIVDSNDLQNIIQYGKFKCRFTGNSGKVMITEGIFVHSSKAFGGSQSNNPNSIRCVTPKWNYGAQKMKLDVTMNDFDYNGNIDYTFGDNLLLHRTAPIAGTLEKSQRNTRLLGQGFRANDTQLNYQNKWGVLETNNIQRSNVQDYKYDINQWLNINPNDELKCYLYEAADFQRFDSVLNDRQTYQLYNQPSPQLKNNNISGISNYTIEGGPFYVEVGRNIEIEQYNAQPQTGRRLQSSVTSYIYYEYPPSAVEFYHYKQCTMLDMQPIRGIISGGTPVQVSGFDFRYMPEWGVVPHCKFGDQIVRGYFDSTVRLVCESPAVLDSIENLSFEISLNGNDWTNTGFTFTYYKEPIMTSYEPDSGQVIGGTTIFIKGQNFPKMNRQSKDFKARFRPQSGRMTPKTMPIEWLNETTIKIVTPGGWSEGDKMDLQMTFNGQDYDKNNFTFTFYNIAQVTPRSGPSDGLGGEIVIKGQGFRPEIKPLCRLNNTEIQPSKWSWTEIRCPYPAAQDGPDFFGNVELAVSANGGVEWHQFTGGFQYYQQPIVYEIDPKIGPAHGTSVINFYGAGFRADYAMADLQCKIGKNVGVGVFVNEHHIRCVVEEMEQISEGERLPAQVALNGYSWTATIDTETGSTFFVPYSINAFFPNSGPQSGSTEIVVIGSGFVEQPLFQPRCRFGTPQNYAIVEATILSYNRLVCVSPPMPVVKIPESLPIEMPFSIALTQDQFNPWTTTHHRFRYYYLPIIESLTPNEVQVGLITEVLVMLDSNVDKNNIFFEPLPADSAKWDLNKGNDESSDEGMALLMGNQIKCKFGRFGETLAVFVNQTAIKCVTPSVLDEPEDIYEEVVSFGVAMNGYDYDFDSTQLTFKFIGTGSFFGLGPTILLILLSGVLLIVVIVFIKQNFESAHLDENPRTNFNGNNVQPNGNISLRSNTPNNRSNRPGSQLP